MSYENCIEVIRKAAGDISTDEIDEIVTELQKRQKRIQLAESLTDVGEAAMRAADSIAKDLEMAAIIEKRNAAINAKARIVATSFVQNNFGDDLVGGVKALLVGTNKLGIANRDSVDARQNAWSTKYTGRLVAELDRAGVQEVFASGTIDRDVARALWSVDGGKFDGPDESMTIAKIINKHQESWRQDLNKHGASIGKIENYIVRQSHDPMKMMRGGFEAWKEEISTKLDWGKIMAEMPDKDPNQFLEQVYKNLVSGNHQKAPADVTAFKGPGNLAKRLSQDRVLHFKDADAWFDYNEKFGKDSIRESVFESLTSSAQAIGLFQKLGTNPKSMVETIVKDLIVTADPIQARNLQQSQKEISNALSSVDGSMKIPANETLARVGQTTRAVQNMAKLTGIVSQASDIPIMATEMRYQGGNLFSGIVTAINGMLSRVGGTSEEKKQFLYMIGKTADLNMGNIAARFSADDTYGGRMARLQDTFFKFNLMRWWQAVNEETAVMWMGHHLARNADKSYDQLGRLSRTLELSGIDAPKWEAIRKGAQTAVDGDMYVSPEAMLELQEDALKPLVQPQLDAMYKRTEDKIASLNERSSIEAQWAESRAKKLMEAHERSAQMLNRMMTSKDMQVARRSEYVEAQKELLQARMERAEAEADIAAYLLAEKQQNKIKDFLDDVADGKFLQRAKDVGESLGKKIGTLDERIKTQEQNVKKLAAKFGREELAKFNELDARLNEIAESMSARGNVESRIARLEKLENDWAQTLNRFMGTRDAKLAGAKEYVDELSSLFAYKIDIEKTRAEQRLNAIAEQQRRAVPTEAIERNVQFVSRARGGIGERLGEKVGRSERRIVELEKSLRDLEARGERQVEAKYKELSDRLFERSKELDSFTAEIETRRAKRELIAKEWQESVGRKEQQIFNDAREELETLVRSYLIDRSSFAVLRPDAKSRAIALQGTQAGTWEGEGLRMLMQFKGFPISFVQKILGREVYGQEGTEQITSIMQVVVATTIFGYMSMAAKDMLKGKEPRDPFDWKTAAAAMQQGGGLGIYGDFLFGEMRNRSGQGFLASLAGPTFGELDKLADLYGRAKNGDDVGAAIQRIILSNTPFANHFMLRPAADYLFLRSITEAINPGALRRMEEKTTKEKEQEWMIRPSETYLDPLGALR
jgi:hypothetical protein